MITVLIILASLVTTHSGGLERVTLVQQQVCHKERDMVICRCYQEQETIIQMPAYLGIRMQGFLMHSGNLEVSFWFEFYSFWSLDQLDDAWEHFEH